MKRRIAIFVCLILAVMSTVACSLKGPDTEDNSQDNEKYTYDNPDAVETVSVKEAVYSKKKLKLNMSGDIDEGYKIQCFDKNFECLDEEWKTDYKNGWFIIEGAKADKISGIKMDNGFYRYEIRYLDSNQYAILVYMFALDEGYSLVEGDELLYYTQEEIDEQNEYASISYNSTYEAFAPYEGLWVNPDDEQMYIEFSTDGKRFYCVCPECYEDAEGFKYYMFDFEIETLNVEIADNGEQYLEALEIDEMVTRVEFIVSEDKNSMWFEDYPDIVYIRK